MMDDVSPTTYYHSKKSVHLIYCARLSTCIRTSIQYHYIAQLYSYRTVVIIISQSLFICPTRLLSIVVVWDRNTSPPDEKKRSRHFAVTSRCIRTAYSVVVLVARGIPWTEKNSALATVKFRPWHDLARRNIHPISAPAKTAGNSSRRGTIKNRTSCLTVRRGTLCPR